MMVRVSLIGRETLIPFEITGAGAEAVEGLRVPVPETPPACTAECDTAGLIPRGVRWWVCWSDDAVILHPGRRLEQR